MGIGPILQYLAQGRFPRWLADRLEGLPAKWLTKQLAVYIVAITILVNTITYVGK